LYPDRIAMVYPKECYMHPWAQHRTTQNPQIFSNSQGNKASIRKSDLVTALEPRDLSWSGVFFALEVELESSLTEYVSE